MVRQLLVLDTGTDSKLIHKVWIHPAYQRTIWSNLSLNITDANNNALQTAESITVLVRLETCLVSLNFIFCERIAALVMLGCVFCDGFVEAKNPQESLVDSEDGSTIPIV